MTRSLPLVVACLISTAFSAPATTLLEQGNYAQAYDAAIAAGDELTASTAALSQGMYRSGDQALWFTRAEQQARKAVQKAPNSAQAHFALASALGQQANHTANILKALERARAVRQELTKTLALKPDYAEAAAALARWNSAAYARAGRMSGGNPDTARKLAAQALAQAPSNIQVLTIVGYLNYDLKDNKQGQALLEKALSLSPRGSVDKDAQTEARAFLKAHK